MEYKESLELVVVAAAVVNTKWLGQTAAIHLMVNYL